MKRNTKLIAPFIALLAAFISCIFSIIQGVSFSVFSKRLAISAIVFLFIGSCVRYAIEYAYKPEPEEETEEDSAEDEEAEGEGITAEEPGTEDEE